MKVFPLAILLVAASVLACQTGVVLAQTDTAPSLKAGTYAIDPARTRVDFALLRLGFAYYSGTFSNPSGTLRLNPARPSETTLQVIMPMGSLSTGNSAVDRDLRGPGWFDAANYPTAVFTSTNVTSTGDDSADITGALTLHGATEVETLAARYVSAGIDPATKVYEVGFEAVTTVKRSHFGLSAFLPVVGDDVRLTITGVVVAQH